MRAQCGWRLCFVCRAVEYREVLSFSVSFSVSFSPAFSTPYLRLRMWLNVTYCSMPTNRQTLGSNTYTSSMATAPCWTFNYNLMAYKFRTVSHKNALATQALRSNARVSTLFMHSKSYAFAHRCFHVYVWSWPIRLSMRQRTCENVFVLRAPQKKKNCRKFIKYTACVTMNIDKRIVAYEPHAIVWLSMGTSYVCTRMCVIWIQQSGWHSEQRFSSSTHWMCLFIWFPCSRHISIYDYTPCIFTHSRFAEQLFWVTPCARAPRVCVCVRIESRESFSS